MELHPHHARHAVTHLNYFFASPKHEHTGRERLVAEAIHSAEMEGLTVSESAVADSGTYIAGKIDSAELVARARARYGLD